MKDFYKTWMVIISIFIFAKLVEIAEYLKNIYIFID